MTVRAAYTPWLVVQTVMPPVLWPWAMQTCGSSAAWWTRGVLVEEETIDGARRGPGARPCRSRARRATLPAEWMGTSSRRQRLVDGEQRRQLLVLDLDERRGRLGGRPARRHDRRDAVADEAHVLAEQRLVVRREVLAGVDARPAEAVHRRVLVREDLDDARQRLGARGVDALDDAVRDGAEDQLRVEHARHAEVAAVDELPRHLLGHVVDGVAAPDVLQVLGQAVVLLSLVSSAVRSGCPEACPPGGSRRTSAGTRPCRPAPPAPRSTRPRRCTAARAAGRGRCGRPRRWPRAAAARPRGRPAPGRRSTCAMHVAAMMRLRHGWLSPPGIGSQGRPMNACSASDAAFSTASGDPPTISAIAAAAIAPHTPDSPVQPSTSPVGSVRV